MVNRAMVPLAALVVAPLGIATWILAAFTVGESLSPRNSTLIGFAIALLVVALLAYLFFFSHVTERSGSHLGVVLVIGGTLCVLGALALQFYLASLTAENSQRLAEIMGSSPRQRIAFFAVYSQAQILRGIAHTPPIQTP